MELKEFVIKFDKDENNNEYATVEVNSDYVINRKGKLDINKDNIGAIYPKKDNNGIDRSILYRISMLMQLIKTDKIEFEL